MARDDRTRKYSTYGSVAYQPEFEGNAVRQPARREAEPRRRPLVQPREQVAARPSVEVRQQSAVAPFAVVGFAAVALCVFLLLSAGAQLAMVADETFDLKSELAQLQTETLTLQAQYEQAYDLEAIEKQLTTSGAMVKASSANTVYLDLAEADNVVYYDRSAASSTLLDRLQEFFAGLVA